MLGQPLQPLLLTLPILDLLLPPIHEPLALEAPIEVSALTDVGFERGDAVGLPRDRLRGEPGGKGADVELTPWRLERILDVDRGARRRSRPELEIGG